MPPATLRQAVLAQVVAATAATNAVYSSLFWPNVITFPVLYFGDPTTARFATFGVNPSADEFRNGRWPVHITVPQLDHRSARYFNNSVPPNDWFEGYEDTRNNANALNLLGYSYRRDAVHIDLTPRATIAAETITKNPVSKRLFLQMISADVRWFFSAIALCSNLKGAIMSGTVTNEYYFDELVKKLLPSGYSLNVNIRFGAGRGATTLYDFSGPSFSIPVLFCRKSPSDRKNKGAFIAAEVARTMPQLKAAGF